jgi:hypothetical protein
MHCLCVERRNKGIGHIFLNWHQGGAGVDALGDGHEVVVEYRHGLEDGAPVQLLVALAAVGGDDAGGGQDRRRKQKDSDGDPEVKLFGKSKRQSHGTNVINLDHPIFIWQC